MTRRPPSPGRLPYVLVRRWADFGAKPRDTLTQRFKSLDRALEALHRIDVAWLQLVGSQHTPLSWHVIDLRDGTKHTRWKLTEEGKRNVEQATSDRRLF